MSIPIAHAIELKNPFDDPEEQPLKGELQREEDLMEEFVRLETPRFRKRLFWYCTLLWALATSINVTELIVVDFVFQGGPNGVREDFRLVEHWLRVSLRAFQFFALLLLAPLFNSIEWTTENNFSSRALHYLRTGEDVNDLTRCFCCVRWKWDATKRKSARLFSKIQ